MVWTPQQQIEFNNKLRIGHYYEDISIEKSLLHFKNYELKEHQTKGNLKTFTADFSLFKTT